ncbi:MAG TPA: AAA family ATPase [Porphyromonadaceae bacterium]|nr:AAA family ATPase [Porphyromonadaceae bacterium]
MKNQTVQRILEFCIEPHSLVEIAAHCGFQNRRKFRERYITPLLGVRLQMTIPDKPTSSRQKYRTVAE